MWLSSIQDYVEEQEEGPPTRAFCPQAKTSTKKRMQAASRGAGDVAETIPNQWSHDPRQGVESVETGADETDVPLLGARLRAAQINAAS